jgi:RHS repeat-associated protein
LLSGNVNLLAYQHGQADAFYYKYEYDADNRVTAAYTHAGPLVSRGTSLTAGSGGTALGVTQNAVELFDRDAKYFYYQHGPLARTEVGQNKVQASDYAYTLHGWIKGVNSNMLTAAKDMGNDANTDPSAATTLNRYVGSDKYGYQLTYYDTTGKKDYTSITTNPAFASQTGSSLSTTSANLWNGNIKNMVTSIAQFMIAAAPRPQARAFTYDQLNRIKVATVDTAFLYSGGSANTWSTGGNLNQWKESFIYDYNGNIKTLVRHGKSPTTMDSLTYNYVNNRNQLDYVDDPVSSGSYGTDIDDQAANNYVYDSIGNLVKDVSEEIDSIIWNVYGKIDRIVRSGSSTKSDLEFRYDAMGKRICKIVKPRSGAGRRDQSYWTYTYYMRDANGNVIAAYDRDYSVPGATYGDTLSLIENHLYGRVRVGVRTVNEVVCTTTYTYVGTSNNIYTGTFSSRTATAASTTNFNHELRRKAYELSNHLGNVLTTVSDARNPENSGGTITYFKAVTLSAQDYYAFGSTMVGRSYTSTSYRYSYNGKEKDSETELQDYGMRIYNERLGRFLSVDLLSMEYPHLTPYQFASNTPIQAIDLDGLEMYYATDGTYIGQIGTSTDVRVCNVKDVDNMQGLISMAHNSIDPKIQEYVKSEALSKSYNLGMSNGELNARAFLSTIKQCENRGNDPLDYNDWNGFVDKKIRKFTDKNYEEAPAEYGDHPGFPKGSGSSAAGAYQFLKPSYDDFKKAYPNQVKDFSPESQDRIALLLIKERGAYNNVIKGENEKAVNKLNKPAGREAWASLPGASQAHGLTMAKFQKLYKQNLINELNNKSNIATPKGLLLNFDRAPNAPANDNYDKFPSDTDK